MWRRRQQLRRDDDSDSLPRVQRDNCRRRRKRGLRNCSLWKDVSLHSKVDWLVELKGDYLWTRWTTNDVTVTEMLCFIEVLHLCWGGLIKWKSRAVSAGADFPATSKSVQPERAICYHFGAVWPDWAIFYNYGNFLTQTRLFSESGVLYFWPILGNLIMK